LKQVNSFTERNSLKSRKLFKSLLISIPLAGLVLVFSAVIGNAVVNGQSSTHFGESSETIEPTYSLLTTTSPSPKPQASSESTQDPQSELPGSTGNSSNRNGAQNAPFMPNWTEAQRACQIYMEQISAGSVRVGAAHIAAWQALSSIQNELQATYGSNPWSAEDTARYQQAQAESDRTSAEVTAFWAQYPWQQWGCNENGFWHVP
jgi:hypothetical protein